MTQTMKASEARANWADLLNKVYTGETQVVVEKSGIPVVAVVSAKDYEEFRRLQQRRAERFAILDRLRDKFKDVPAAEIEQGVARAVSQARAEIRAKQASSNRDEGRA